MLHYLVPWITVSPVCAVDVRGDQHISTHHSQQATIAVFFETLYLQGVLLLKGRCRTSPLGQVPEKKVS